MTVYYIQHDLAFGFQTSPSVPNNTKKQHSISETQHVSVFR